MVPAGESEVADDIWTNRVLVVGGQEVGSVFSFHAHVAFPPLSLDDGGDDGHE